MTDQDRAEQAQESWRGDQHKRVRDREQQDGAEGAKGWRAATGIGWVTRQEKADFKAQKAAGTLGPKHGVRRDLAEAVRTLRGQQRDRGAER